MKYKLSKAEHEKLSADAQKEYNASGDSFTLKIEGGPDIAGLEKKADLETKHRKAAEEKFTTSQSELKASEKTIEDMRLGNIPKDDVDALKASWETKFDTQKAGYETQLTALNASQNKLLIDNVAQAMASEISKSPTLILPHIKARLAVDMRGGEPKTIVNDLNGKESALTVAELKAEFQGNKDFADIIIANRSSGGGANGGGNGSAIDEKNKNTTVDKLSPKDMAARITAQRNEKGLEVGAGNTQ